MCSSVAECVLNRGESVVQSLALRKKINHTSMFTHMYVCAQEKYLGSTRAQGACCIHPPCDSASQNHIKEKRSSSQVGSRPPFIWSQGTFPGFPTEYKLLYTYTLNINSIRWQCCPSCHPSLNLACCLCQHQLLPRTLTVMTLHLGLGRPNLWQQPGEQSLPS